MSKAKGRSITPKVTFFDPRKIPNKLFGLTVQGDCMSPVIPDGSNIIVHRDEHPNIGDFAAFFFKPEALLPGELQIKVKRLASGMRPYKDESGATLGLVILANDAKGRHYAYPCDELLAVCRCEIPDEHVVFTKKPVAAKAVLKPSASDRAHGAGVA